MNEDITRPRLVTPTEWEIMKGEALPLTRSKARPIPHGYAVSVRRRFGIPGMNGFTETFEVAAVFMDAEEAQSWVDGHDTPDNCTINTVPIVEAG